MSAGSVDTDGSAPMRRDSIFRIASLAKLVMAAAVLRLGTTAGSVWTTRWMIGCRSCRNRRSCVRRRAPSRTWSRPPDHGRGLAGQVGRGDEVAFVDRLAQDEPPAPLAPFHEVEDDTDTGDVAHDTFDQPALRDPRFRHREAPVAVDQGGHRAARVQGPVALGEGLGGPPTNCCGVALPPQAVISTLSSCQASGKRSPFAVVVEDPPVLDQITDREPVEQGVAVPRTVFTLVTSAAQAPAGRGVSADDCRARSSASRRYGLRRGGCFGAPATTSSGSPRIRQSS